MGIKWGSITKEKKLTPDPTPYRLNQTLKKAFKIKHERLLKLDVSLILNVFKLV